MQKTYPTRDAAVKYAEAYISNAIKADDANDLLYQVAASRNYDPSRALEKIQAPVTWVNSADDFINPPELGLTEGFARRLRRGRFILIPASDQTHGHGTHTWAAVWQSWLAELLKESEAK
jgi:homoserine O-acetyltransferase